MDIKCDTCGITAEDWEVCGFCKTPRSAEVIPEPEAVPAVEATERPGFIRGILESLG